MPGDILLTVSGVELACGEKQPQVSIMAYSGAAMRVPGWGVIVLDLAGLDLSGRVPILCDHDASLDGILGQGAAEVKDGKLFVSGAILPASDKARRVVELARGGFLFEASVGVEPSEHVRIKAGERIAANNRTLTAPEGGFTLIRKGKLREVSVVSLGADNRTSVAIAAMKMKENANVSAPSKACDLQSVKVRHRESQASTLLPNVQTGRQQTV